MNDLEALWESVRQFPHADAPFQMLLDELIERGDERAADVLRWGASASWTVKLVKSPKLISRPVQMPNDWLNVPKNLFDIVTEAVAETTLAVFQSVLIRLRRGDRVLVRANGYAFVAVVESVEDVPATILYAVRAKSVGEVDAAPLPVAANDSEGATHDAR